MTTTFPRNCRKLKGAEFSHTRRFLAPARYLCPPSSRRLFQALANQRGAMLHQLAVLCGKCCREVAVNVEFADYLAVHEHGHHDLGLGLGGAGKVTRKGAT